MPAGGGIHLLPGRPPRRTGGRWPVLAAVGSGTIDNAALWLLVYRGSQAREGASGSADRTESTSARTYLDHGDLL